MTQRQMTILAIVFNLAVFGMAMGLSRLTAPHGAEAKTIAVRP